MKHKHLPEMQTHGLLDLPPVFSPSVGNFRRGMLVSVPLQAAQLPGRRRERTARRVRRALRRRGVRHGAAAERHRGAARRRVPRAGGLNGTNRLELFVFANDARQQALVIARLDNLGKGASGAAVQNLNLMLGLPEGAGLD
jgi:N-acetyl-gamma-glutamyl-phosphate reductase